LEQQSAAEAPNMTTIATEVKNQYGSFGAICATFLHTAVPLDDALREILPYLRRTQKDIERAAEREA
jgi:hypothetical protein